MTGAAMPAGADAVVMVEETEAGDDGSRPDPSARSRPATRCERRASDVRAGERVFEPQTVIRPAHLGVLASLGFARVPVYPRARVGVISTGDELVEGGGPLAPGQIRESNREMLLALVEQANCVPVDLGLVRDDKDEIAEVVPSRRERVRRTDLVGRREHGRLRPREGRARRDRRHALDADRDQAGEAVRVRARRTTRTPVFGLPGNPVSSLVSFELFARPALRQMMGHADIDRPRLAAVADADLRRRPRRQDRTISGSPAGSTPTVATTSPPSGRRARTSSPRPRTPMRSSVLPDGDGVARGRRRRRLVADLNRCA